MDICIRQTDFRITQARAHVARVQRSPSPTWELPCKNIHKRVAAAGALRMNRKAVLEVNRTVLIMYLVPTDAAARNMYRSHSVKYAQLKIAMAVPLWDRSGSVSVSGRCSAAVRCGTRGP